MSHADDFLAELTDGSFREWSREVVSDDPLRFSGREAYSSRLAELQATDPQAEAVRVGFAAIGGHESAVICSDYDFMAGTLGVAAAERVARAFVVATASRRPVVGICRSGGTRMQEGTPAFIKMLSIGAAVSEHREAGLPYLSYLMDPAMGGALAAWGTQGHLVWAEPGASISLTGPRVVKAVIGETVPLDEISSEAAMERGLVDDLVHPVDLARRIGEWLDIVVPPINVPARPEPPAPDEARAREHQDTWQSVIRSRSDDRPSIDSLLQTADSPLIEIRGDRAGADDRGLLAGFAKFRGEPAVAIGFRRPGGRGAEVSASGYRKAQRAVWIAEELGLPVVSFIDTRGTGAGAKAEQEGLGHAVGTLIRQLLGIRVPTVSILMGEGAGAGAIALLAADTMIALEDSWLAPIAPEAGSAILFRNTEEAPTMARGQGADVETLRGEGLIDLVLPEEATMQQTCERLVDAVAWTLRRASSIPPEERLLTRRVNIRSLARQHLIIRDPAPGAS